MTQQRAEETRERILNAALHSFAEHGYDAAGVAEICRRAGVSKGAFYHHFPTKQTLFLALLEEWLQGIDAQLASRRAHASNIPEALRDMSSLMDVVLHEARGQLPLFLEFLSQAARDPTVWEATIAYYRRYHRYFTEMIDAGIIEGSIQPAEADIIAWVVLSFAVGLLLQGVLESEGADWGKIARQGMEILLMGIMKNQCRSI